MRKLSTPIKGVFFFRGIIYIGMQLELNLIIDGELPLNDIAELVESDLFKGDNHSQALLS